MHCSPRKRTILSNLLRNNLMFIQVKPCLMQVGSFNFACRFDLFANVLDWHWFSYRLMIVSFTTASAFLTRKPVFLVIKQQFLASRSGRNNHRHCFTWSQESHQPLVRVVTETLSEPYTSVFSLSVNIHFVEMKIH